jgi:hypothetical protein
MKMFISVYLFIELNLTEFMQTVYIIITQNYIKTDWNIVYFQRSRVRFPALRYFLSSHGSETRSTQAHEDK